MLNSLLVFADGLSSVLMVSFVEYLIIQVTSVPVFNVGCYILATNVISFVFVLCQHVIRQYCCLILLLLD